MDDISCCVILGLIDERSTLNAPWLNDQCSVHAGMSLLSRLLDACVLSGLQRLVLY